MPGNDNHRTIVISLTQHLQHGNSIHARHSHICYDATALGNWGRINESDGRFVCLDHKPVRLKQKSKRIPCRPIVVDDTNDFFASHVCISSVETPGSVTQKVVPSPGLVSTLSWPPCASMIVRQIERPTPIPCFFVVTNG